MDEETCQNLTRKTAKKKAVREANKKWANQLHFCNRLVPFRLLSSPNGDDLTLLNSAVGHYHPVFRLHPRNLIDLQFPRPWVIIELYTVPITQQLVYCCYSFGRKLDLCPHLFHLIQHIVFSPFILPQSAHLLNGHVMSCLFLGCKQLQNYHCLCTTSALLIVPRVT